MVLDLDRKPALGGIERRAFRHRPGTERAVELEAEVVVKPPCGVLLHDEAQFTGAPRAVLPAARFGGALEVALGTVTGQA